MLDHDSTQTLVAVRGVEMQFGEKRVLDGVDLDVTRGEILAIVGGSGSGNAWLSVARSSRSRRCCG